MCDETLRQAIQLIKSGDKQKGANLLRQITEKDLQNENAWLWLVVCANNNDERIEYLNRVLAINPDNIKARQALNQITPKESEPSLEDLLPSEENVESQPTASFSQFDPFLISKRKPPIQQRGK